MTSTPAITEADILEDVVSPNRSGLSAEAARSFLLMRFSKKATKRIRQLLQKNNRGTITGAERVLLERYLRVGHFWISCKQRRSSRSKHRVLPSNPWPNRDAN